MQEVEVPRQAKHLVPSPLFNKIFLINIILFINTLLANLIIISIISHITISLAKIILQIAVCT